MLFLVFFLCLLKNYSVLCVLFTGLISKEREKEDMKLDGWEVRRIWGEKNHD